MEMRRATHTKLISLSPDETCDEDDDAAWSFGNGNRTAFICIFS